MLFRGGMVGNGRREGIGGGAGAADDGAGMLVLLGRGGGGLAGGAGAGRLGGGRFGAGE